VIGEDFQMRFPGIVMALIGLLVGSIGRAEAGAIYKMRATKALKDYGELELTFEGNKVFGQARPQRGYPTPAPIEVTGASRADNTIELTFQLRKPERRTFKKTMDDQDIVWTSANDREFIFRRPRQGDPSDADLVLNQSECGPLYRSLRFWPLKGGSKDQLQAFLSGNPAIADLPVEIDAAKPEEVSVRSQSLPLGAALHELWPRRYRNFAVPLGTEATVVIALRQSGFMGAELAEGGCADLDLPARLIYDRAFLFEGGTFQKEKFLDFLEENLNGFAGRDRTGQTFEYVIERGAVSTLPIAPFTSSYRVKMRVASEVSRQVAGRWDSFEILFEPAELILNTRSDYSVLVSAGNVRSADRSTGRYIPFRGGLSRAMDEIEASLVVFLSQRVKDGRCWSNGRDPSKVTCQARQPRRAQP
jgi:hypothetical protein